MPDRVEMFLDGGYFASRWWRVSRRGSSGVRFARASRMARRERPHKLSNVMQNPMSRQFSIDGPRRSIKGVLELSLPRCPAARIPRGLSAS